MDKQYLQFLKKSKFNHQKAKQYQKAYHEIKKTDLFNEEFYLEQYPNVANANIDPLTHYLFHGGAEGKYPSTKFNGNQYLNQNQTLIKQNINPLAHYILKGKKEGQKTYPVNYHQQKEHILKNNLLYLHNYKFTKEPLVSIIILNRNGQHHLKRLFKNFKNTTNYENYEIIIVDNASTDQSIQYLNTLKNTYPITIIENTTNQSFSHANNQAVQKAKGELILLLNNDIEPTYGWLNEMVGTIQENPKIAAVGAKLIYPYYFDRISPQKSFTIQHAKVKFEEVINPHYDYGPIHENIEETDIFNQKYNKKEECLAVTAACTLIRKTIYEKLGGLDENYFYGYEDVDFMLKIHKHGYKVIYNGAALLIHHESSTRNNEGAFAEINEKNIKTLMKKWEKYLHQQILQDKIQHKKFFTNQKLTIGIINTNTKNNEKISKLAQELNTKQYNIELINNILTRQINKETDILLSFNLDYRMHKAITRKHTIKIYYTEDKITQEIIKQTTNYDLILTTNPENKTEENIFQVDKLNTENILDTVQKFYNIQ